MYKLYKDNLLDDASTYILAVPLIFCTFCWKHSSTQQAGVDEWRMYVCGQEYKKLHATTKFLTLHQKSHIRALEDSEKQEGSTLCSRTCIAAWYAKVTHFSGKLEILLP